MNIIEMDRVTCMAQGEPQATPQDMPQTTAQGTVRCIPQGEKILDDVSLDVRQGECVLLCGPSGMGKTTLTKCINGLIPSFELGIGLVGAVRVCGLVPGTCETYELAKRVGSVFQNPKSQFYHLTSDDELVFGLENAGADVGRIERRRSEVVSEMGIQRLLHRDVSKMSGGEKQALAFASVAVADPDVYVLDEPTANLDAAAIDVLRRQIAGVVALGKTVIVAEHRLAFLHGIIDRAVLLEDGRIKRSMSSLESSWGYRRKSAPRLVSGSSIRPPSRPFPLSGRSVFPPRLKSAGCPSATSRSSVMASLYSAPLTSISVLVRL